MFGATLYGNRDRKNKLLGTHHSRLSCPSGAQGLYAIEPLSWDKQTFSEPVEIDALDPKLTYGAVTRRAMIYLILEA